MKTSFRETMDVLESRISERSKDEPLKRSRSTQPFSRRSIGNVYGRAQDAMVARTSQLSPELRDFVLECLDEALEVMGRTGVEVFFGVLHGRYGMTRDDIVESPGKFMSVLKLVLDSSALVLEGYALAAFERRTKISASSLEEAVSLLEKISRSANFEEEELESGSLGRRGEESEHGAKFAYHYNIASTLTIDD